MASSQGPPPPPGRRDEPDLMPGVDPAPGNGARPNVSADATRADIPGQQHRAVAGGAGSAGDYSRPTTGDYPRPSTGDYPLPPRQGGLGGGDGLRLEPPSAAPRRRLPELVLGVFLVAGCALAAVLLAAAGRERTQALALANDVQRGQVITDADLQTIYVGSDTDLALVDPDDAAQIVDRAALASLPAGTLVTTEQFVDPASVLTDGDATIALSLEEGDLPSLELAPGDRVRVVAGGGSATTDTAAIDEIATVESVTQLDEDTGQQARWRVSLRLPEGDATDIAQALTNNAQVRLVMVER
ncbi:MAG: SAF domain-containing protein [Acidimicrobiales bacterium]